MEVKDVLSYLGFEKVESIDDFKKNFDKQFVAKDKALEDTDLRNKAFGEQAGRVTTKFKQLMKSHGVEFDEKELKESIEIDGKSIERNKPIEQVFEIGITKFNDMHVATQKELEKKTAEPAQAYKELEERYGKAQTKLKNLEELHSTTKSELIKAQESHAQEMKNIKVDTIRKSAMGTIQWKKEITDLEKKGFESYFNERYRIDLDDNGEPFVADKSGNRIKSEKKAGTWKSIEEVLAEEVINNKLHQVNPHAGKPNGVPQQWQAPETDKQQTRRAHPKALLG